MCLTEFRSSFGRGAFSRAHPIRGQKSTGNASLEDSAASKPTHYNYPHSIPLPIQSQNPTSGPNPPTQQLYGGDYIYSTLSSFSSSKPKQDSLTSTTPDDYHRLEESSESGQTALAHSSPKLPSDSYNQPITTSNTSIRPITASNSFSRPITTQSSAGSTHSYKVNKAVFFEDEGGDPVSNTEEVSEIILCNMQLSTYCEIPNES